MKRPINKFMLLSTLAIASLYSAETLAQVLSRIGTITVAPSNRNHSPATINEMTYKMHCANLWTGQIPKPGLLPEGPEFRPLRLWCFAKQSLEVALAKISPWTIVLALERSDGLEKPSARLLVPFGGCK